MFFSPPKPVLSVRKKKVPGNYGLRCFPAFRVNSCIHLLIRNVKPDRRAGTILSVSFLYREYRLLFGTAAMLHLHFAPSLDMLVPDLLSGVREVWTDPFDAPDILVPSPALGKWLRMRLAGGCADKATAAPLGCVANLELPTIEKYLWNLLSPGEFRQLGQQHMQQVLCALLDEQCIGAPGFEPVKTYLLGATGSNPLKKVQLSARIAHQFLEYEYNRPGVWRDNLKKWEPTGIDGTWMAGKFYTDNIVNETWQAELYRRMRSAFSGCNNGSGSTQPSWLTLPQLYRLRRRNGFDDNRPWVVDPMTAFIFGVTKVSHFHRNLFVEISQFEGVELHVFLTNPCAEFWEDVDTTRRNIRRTWSSTSASAAIIPRKPDDYHKDELLHLSTGIPPDDQKLLELWGNAGKENIFLWCQDAQWNFEYHSPERIDHDDPPESILQSLQNALLRREKEMILPSGGYQPDGSLQILACPDRGREIEEIREQILDLVHCKKITMLNEVVVYLADIPSYVPSIQRVFGRFTPYDAEYIPFCILGSTGGSTAYARGVVQLIELMRNRFDRVHLFGLFRNAIVQATRKIDPDDVAVWEGWAEALSMYRGYNLEHRKQMGDTGQTLTDAHTFAFGMARMVLADLMEGAALLDFREHHGDSASESGTPIPVIPYRDFDTSDRNLLESFCSTVESLYRDGEQLRADVAESLEKGVATLCELLSKWLGKIPESRVVDLAAEGSIQRAFQDGLASLPLQQQLVGRAEVPFEEFMHLVLGCLPDEPADSHGAWTGGITFAPLRPSLIVPHTVVFAAGLDDVLFPGSNERPSWDLLSGRRIIGDSDRVRENRFAFLELLHAARKQLILSYRARNMQKESELHPSSVVQELEAYLVDNSFSVPDKREQPVCSLRRTIPWIVHESLPEIAAYGREHGTWNPEEITLARLAAKERVHHRHDLAKPGITVRGDNGPPLATLYELRLFFSNPLEYHLVRTLGIEQDEAPGTMSATDEPLESGALFIALLQKDIWALLLRHVFPEKNTEELLDPAELGSLAVAEAERLYAHHAASGGAPEAMPGIMERDFLLKWASMCLHTVLSLRNDFSDHRFIENSDCALGREEHNGVLQVPLTTGTEGTVECRHRMALVPRESGPSGVTGIIAVKKEGKAIDNPDLWLEGALQWLWEQQHPPGSRIALVQLNRGNGTTIWISSDVVRLLADASCNDIQPEMMRWLAGMLIQMKQSRCSEHLPFVEVKKFWGNLSCDQIAEDLASDYSAYHSYLPVFALVDARVPDLSAEELESLARSRYAPMLDRWLIAGEGTA